jgi:type IV secretory pathway protease TraF
MTRERLKTITIIAETTLLLLLVFAIGFRWSGYTGAVFSDSEPQGIYRTINRPLHRGGMVELRKLTKHVAGVPGDTVRVAPEGIYINDKLWPYSAVPKGCNYTPFPYGTYHLAAGQWWIMGMNPWSYDSRFFGPIPTNLIASSVVPVITFSNGYAPGTLTK